MFVFQTKPRTDEELDEMLRRMKKIANEYDFDLHSYGNSESMFIVLQGEHELLERYKNETSTTD